MVGKTLGADAQLALRPFDVIVVPESKITHVDRWVDQYIRKLLPVDLTAGFQYVYSKSSQLIFPF